MNKKGAIKEKQKFKRLLLRHSKITIKQWPNRRKKTRKIRTLKIMELQNLTRKN